MSCQHNIVGPCSKCMTTDLSYNDGLERAAKLLEATAADCDQMAAQRLKGLRRGTLGFAEHHRQAGVLHEKSRLLRGQAGYIRAYKV
jgi:hypothetical protein